MSRQNCYTLHTKWYSLSRWVITRLVSSETTKSTVALKEHTLWWLWHHHTDDRCFSTSYTRSITLKTLYGGTYHQHDSTLEKDACPSYWGENFVILRNCSDQTVKKWGNSTWGQVVGRDNWTYGTNELSTRAGKCIHREFSENTWNKFKKAEEQWRCRIPDLLSAKKWWTL